MTSITIISSAWHLWSVKTKPNQIAKNLDVDRATVYRWIKKFKYLGYRRTLIYYQNCKRRKRHKRITQEIKLKVFEIRNKHHSCCGEKVKYYLERDHQIKISVASVYRILKTKLKLSGKYKKWKYGEAPKGKYERDVIQTDTVDFGEVYAYTYIDTFTRQAFVDLESADGYASLTAATKKFKQVRLLQNNGGPEFKAEFAENIKIFAHQHRMSRPYKKNEQSFIESFNRTLRKECLGWHKYYREELPEMVEKVDNFLKYYNNERAHLSLNMKAPNEVAICRI